eukprot:Gb_28324 [translate_table: standard]
MMEHEIQLIDYFEDSLTENDIFVLYVSLGATSPRAVGGKITMHSLPSKILDKVTLVGSSDKTRLGMFQPSGDGSFCQSICTDALLPKVTSRFVDGTPGVCANSSVGKLVSLGSDFKALLLPEATFAPQDYIPGVGVSGVKVAGLGFVGGLDQRVEGSSLGFVGNNIQLEELQDSARPQFGEFCGQKKRRVIKSHGGGISLVVREDIRFDQIGLLEGKTLVGKFLGRWVSLSTLRDWMRDWIKMEWAPLLGYGPIFHLLAKGWIGLIFRDEGTSVWVKLPSLSMELWSDCSFRSIGETLGKFILSDDSYKISTASSGLCKLPLPGPTIRWGMMVFQRDWTRFWSIMIYWKEWKGIGCGWIPTDAHITFRSTLNLALVIRNLGLLSNTILVGLKRWSFRNYFEENLGTSACAQFAHSLRRVKDKSMAWVEGNKVRGFQDLAAFGVQHFSDIFKEPDRSNIGEIIKVATYFPRMVSDKDNAYLFRVVTKEELVVLNTLQKDKSPGPDGWSVEFYLDFFELLGDDLLRVIEEFGFLEGRLIHEAIRTAQEVLVNVSTSPFFKSSRGLRQGCPLSPYLFLLVAEGLNRSIKEAKRQRILQGIKSMKDLLQLFNATIGMEVNWSKSALYTYDMDDQLISRWLSTGGRLVLVKSVLEAIPMFWHTIAHIPKGILEKIRKCCFNYLWKGSSKFKGSYLAKLQLIASPKGLGGWGLKNIHLFRQSLAAKSLWLLISKESLWRRIIIQKYIAPNSLIDWIRMERKSIHNVSNQWKAMTLAFLVIGWMPSHSLGLDEEMSQQWEVYLIELKKAHIRLKEEPNELVWAMNRTGESCLGRIYKREEKEALVGVLYVEQMKRLPLLCSWFVLSPGRCGRTWNTTWGSRTVEARVHDMRLPNHLVLSSSGGKVGSQSRYVIGGKGSRLMGVVNKKYHMKKIDKTILGVIESMVSVLSVN